MKLSSIILFLFLWALSPKITAQQTFRVLIDAGHGGKDNGTVGAKSVEKDIVLDLAKRLALKSSSEIQILLTRDSDEFIKLKKRADLANSNDIDLFISLHCNHINLSYVNGTEVYVHGSGHSHEDHSIAKRENGGFYEEEEVEENMSFILNGIEDSAFLEQSLSYGNHVINAFNSDNKLKQRGLRQANFRVLKTLNMPGVLVEIAYLSNPNDEAYITSEAGKMEVLESLWESIVSYKSTLPDSSEVFLAKTNK